MLVCEWDGVAVAILANVGEENLSNCQIVLSGRNTLELVQGRRAKTDRLDGGWKGVFDLTLKVPGLLDELTVFIHSVLGAR
jgi:hypothetical protein